jgi:hypothetical protein
VRTPLRILARAAVVVIPLMTAGVIAVTVGAQAANASGSSGCTNAQGGIGAVQCITLDDGSVGLFVGQVYNQYYASPATGTVANVCNRHHQTTYYNSNGTQGVVSSNPTSCILGVVAVATGDYSRWSPYRNFPNHKNICARTRNSDTNEQWTPYACLNIHS